jgi:hypothetical protein
MSAVTVEAAARRAHAIAAAPAAILVSPGLVIAADIADAVISIVITGSADTHCARRHDGARAAGEDQRFPT